MSTTNKEVNNSKASKKRGSQEGTSRSGSGDSASLAGGSPTGSPKVSSKPSSQSLALKLTPSTTMDALTYWNECLDRAGSNDPRFNTIDLEGQSYPADFVHSLADIVKSNNYLVHLNLSRHQPGNTGIKALCLGLRSNTTVKKLFLAHTGMGVVGGQALCDLLIVNKSLVHLNLAGNTGIAECGPRFAEVMKTNKSLLILNVSECNFTAAPWRDALRWNNTLIELEASISIPHQNEITFGGASGTSRALSASFGTKQPLTKGSSSASVPAFSLFSSGSSSSNPDRIVQPLTNEPNSDCQLMVKTNKVLGTLSSFIDENRDVEAFVSHLQRKHPTILIDACRRGHQAAVHRLLELGVDPNESVAITRPSSPRKSQDGIQSPHHAISSPATTNSPSKQDKDHPASPSGVSFESHTIPLQEAILHGNVHIIKLLISYGATIGDDVIASLPNSSSNPLRASQSITNSPGGSSSSSSSGSSGQSLSREILRILKDGQNGIIDLSNGTYQLFGPSAVIARPGIQGLRLSHNNLGPSLPPFLMASLLQMGSQLTTLKLKGNGLMSIPSQIGDLVNLNYLSLNDNCLETLPASLGQLANLKTLKIRKNPLSLLPDDIVKKGTARVLQYLKEITVPVHQWTRMKLLVVGKENVGKTHLIRRLQKREYSQNMSTDGLEISDVPVAKKVDFCIFDFGGQQVFYPTHMFFLSDRALYTVVFSALDDESFRTVEYWLKVIRALAAGSAHTPVVLVATHMDDPQAASAIPDLKDRIKKLRTSYRTVLRDVIYVSNKTGDGHRELKAKLVELASQHKILTSPVPECYVLMEKLIAKEKSHQRPLLMWGEFRAIARNAHIYDDSTLRACSQFMHDVGNIIWFNQPELSELVILDPQWLSDVMASVISFKANWKSGLLQHDSLPIVWKQYPASLHKTLLGILERFEVVFPIKGGEGASIVPTMLPDTSSEVMETFCSLQLPRNLFQRIERTFRFGFMPIGFFSRLVARLFLIPNLFCHDPWLRGLMVSPPSIFNTVAEQFDARTSDRMDATEAASPMADLLSKFLSKTATFSRGNIRIGEAERTRILQQYATLTALMRGFEQSSISYYEGSSASILNIIIWRPLPPHGEGDPHHPPPDNLMTYIVDTVEELLATNYKKYDDSIERIMVHTASTNMSHVTEIALPDLIHRISAGERTIQCRDEVVSFDDLAPDVCFTDVHRFTDVQIERELGEGGVGLIFLANVPTEELEPDHTADSIRISPAVSVEDGLVVSRSPSSADLLHSSSDLSLSGLNGGGSGASTPLSLSNGHLKTGGLTGVAMSPISEEPELDSASASMSSTPATSHIKIETPKSPIYPPSISTPPLPPSTSPSPEPGEDGSKRSPQQKLRRSKDKKRTLLVDTSASAEELPGFESPLGGSPRDDILLKKQRRSSIDSTPSTPRTGSGKMTAAKDLEELSRSSDGNSPRMSTRLLSSSAKTPREVMRTSSTGSSSGGGVGGSGGGGGNPDSTAAVVGGAMSAATAATTTTAGTSSSSSSLQSQKATKSKNGRTQIALKRFKVSTGMEVQRFREFAHEVRLMASLNHPCIVRLHGVQLSPLGMVMEYISGKDLCTILHNPLVSDEAFTWRIRAKLALDIARGMRYLQAQTPPIVHRDLRSPNIFVMGLDEHLEVSAKVADFGLSMRVLSNFNDVLQTWQWLAPEVIDMNHCNYDETSDVYSYGIVLWEIATRKFPFSEYTAYIIKDRFELSNAQMQDPQMIAGLKGDGWEISGKVAVRETYNRQKFVDLILKEDLRPTIPSKVPPAFAKLIEMCWARDPSQRPSFQTIVSSLAKMLGTDKTRRWTTRAGFSSSSGGLAVPKRAASNKDTPGSGLTSPRRSTSLNQGSSSSLATSSTGSLNLEPPHMEDEHSASSGSPGSTGSGGKILSSDPTASAVAAAALSIAASPSPPVRKLGTKKANPNLLSTLGFLQKLQDDDGDEHGLDQSAAFENLVTRTTGTDGSGLNGGGNGGDGSSSRGDMSPHDMDDDSPRDKAPPRVGSRPSLFSSGIHSSNLAVTGQTLPTSSSQAPVILTRVLDEPLTQSAMVMAQADETKIWIGQQDGRVAVFELTSPPKFVTSFIAHKKDVFAMTVVGQEMWIGSADATISVWSIKKLKLKKILKDHAKVVRCLLSIPKIGKNNPVGFVISGDTDGVLIVWKNFGMVNKFVVAPNQPINSLVYVEESKHLWVGTYKKIFVYSVQDWSLVTEIDAHEGMISAMVKTGDMVWTCCSNTNSISCWDAKTLVNRMSIKGTPRITCLTLVTHPINQTIHLWAGSLEKVIYLYDCATGELVESLKGHTDYVYSMLKLYNQQSVWSAGRDCTVRTWNF